MAFAPHWYDGVLLTAKRFLPFLAYDWRSGKLVVGKSAVRRSMAAQLAHLKRGAAQRMEGAPVLLGEFGIPFDLDHGRAYRTGDFRAQVAALERSFRAIEANLLDCAIWNYAADNTNARGDLWNGEDLSIFSRDQQDDPMDPDSGGRGLRALVRPYPRATAGTPLAEFVRLPKPPLPVPVPSRSRGRSPDRDLRTGAAVPSRSQSRGERRDLGAERREAAADLQAFDRQERAHDPPLAVGGARSTGRRARREGRRAVTRAATR